MSTRYKHRRDTEKLIQDRRGFLRTLFKGAVIASTFGAVGTLDALLGCSSNFQRMSPLEKVRNDQPFVILIDRNEDIKEVSKIAGYEGKYGHIELVYRSIAYGVSMGEKVGISRNLPLNELEDMLKGSTYEVRELDIQNPHRAVQYFSSVLKGREYSNPADMIIDMCNGSENRLHSVYPIALDTPEKTNRELKEALEARGIAIPNNGFLYLPEQFRLAGLSSGTSIFGQEKR